MLEVRVRSTDASMSEGIKRYLTQLMADRFFGVVQIQFVNGEIILLREEKSFKPAAFLVVE